MSVRTEQDGQVLTVTIDREEARNALNGEVLDGLIAAFDAARRDDAVRVVVLTGAGERAFCAGADLAGGLQGGEGGAVAEHDARGMLRDLFAAVERLDKPLVGRLNGHALAGGMGVALACDLLVAADDVELGTPEVRVGLWPFVISALIAEHVGPKRALDLMMTGRRIAADEALAWGLVNRVVPRAELDQAVATLAGELASGSPVAFKLGRRSFHESRDMGPHAAMAYLHGMLDLATRTEDVVEGVTAFFSKREPEWKGR
ncbi:MAG: enoyl-CoA hydratase/isomerase family protein [Actinobacteria bacterium]|nr:enoyl-CoA hydratase/isomerase family protein [Actinomycetota bacterium]